MTLALAALLLLVGCSKENPGTIDANTDGSIVGPVSGTSAEVTPSDAGDGEEDASDWYAALSAEEQAIADCVLRSAKAVGDRDLEAYMSTVDPEGKAYESTREDAEYILDNYRLSVTVDTLKVVKQSGDSATVSVTQTTVGVTETEPVSGSDVSGSDVSAADLPTDKTASFTPCVTVLTHTMTRRDGAWYITSTVVESYRSINTQWDLLAAMTAAAPETFVQSGVNGTAVSSGDAVSSSDAASAADAQ